MTKLARLLRSIASAIDNTGDPFRDFSVAAMNRYIGKTERYVVALEARARAAGVPDVELDGLRGFHGRFDTSRLVAAGAWSLEINLGEKIKSLAVALGENENTRRFEGVIFTGLQTIRGQLPGRATHTVTFVADVER